MDERAGAASNEVIVDSLTLNDLEGTDLVQQLERIRQAHGGARCASVLSGSGQRPR